MQCLYKPANTPEFLKINFNATFLIQQKKSELIKNALKRIFYKTKLTSRTTNLNTVLDSTMQ